MPKERATRSRPVVDMVSGIMDELRSLQKDVEGAKKAPNARMDSIEASWQSLA